MGNSVFLRDLVLAKTLLARSALPQIFVSLHEGDPGDTGRAELAGGEYVRQMLILGRSAPGVATNQRDIEFDGLPEAAITHFGIWDARAEGHYLTGGPLGVPTTVAERQALRWREAEIVLRIG